MKNDVAMNSDAHRESLEVILLSSFSLLTPHIHTQRHSSSGFNSVKIV